MAAQQVMGCRCDGNSPKVRVDSMVIIAGQVVRVFGVPERPVIVSPTAEGIRKI